MTQRNPKHRNEPKLRLDRPPFRRLARLGLVGLLTVPLAFGGLFSLSACDDSSDSGPQIDEGRSTSDLPITRVVLYRSGIAYVERQGSVEDNTLTLQIEPEQINDILNTLMIIVDDGENVASNISLPIERAMAEALDQLPDQVRQQGGMLGLLRAFRGAEVDLTVADETITGRIVGSENLANDDGNLIPRVTLMTADGVLRQVRVDEVDAVRMRNDILEIGLSKSLDVSLGEGDWKPVELTIHLSGEGPHNIFLSYVVEMPTWKPTYRIIVGDDNDDDDELYLQGWAVIDNVSGEDWIESQLSLVTGRPISFEYDLHSPHFVGRPDLTHRGLDPIALMAPEVDYGTVTTTSSPDGVVYLDSTSEFNRNGDGDGEGAYAVGGLPYTGNQPAEEVGDPYYRGRELEHLEDNDRHNARDRSGNEQNSFQPRTDMLVGSLRTDVQTSRLDNLFRYDVDYPVTVPDRSSALVTIINERLEGEDVLYFDPSDPNTAMTNRPYRAIRLVNNSDLTIEQGPLSIIKDNTFVGQAIAPQIGAGEMIFLPYSLEGRLHVAERQSFDEEGIRLVRIVNSMIFSEVQHINRRSYEVLNNSGEAMTMYVRIPKRTNWFLRNPTVDSEGVIDQGDVWYVPIEIAAEGRQEFVIEEATLVTQEVDVFSALAVDTIGLYLNAPNLRPEIAEQLASILEHRNRIAEIERDTQTLRTRRDDVYRQMYEVRENIDVLGNSRDARRLRRRLESRLGNLESESTELTVEIVALEEEGRERGAEIRMALLDLSLDDELSDTTEDDDTEDPEEEG